MNLARLDLAALAARVVVPLLDLRRPDRDAEWARAEARARAGFGGFLLFGGELPELPARLAALRAAAGDPAGAPFVCADLERGLGQQVRGGTRVPPAMALGAAGSPELARRAGAALGREALAAGIDWVLGPVLDLSDEPRNPIVGTRALGADPARVAALGAAWIEGLQAAGALACAKHYPGHGATTDDSHAALPRVTRPGEALRARDLAPFRAAVAAGVASVMTAHVAYPTLEPGPAGPATLSRALVQELLRGELGYQGLVVTDALIMDGVRQELSEEAAACAALAAGCDALLYPHDPEAVAGAVAAWAARDPAHERRLREAAGRVLAARGRWPAPDGTRAGEVDAALPLELSRAALCRAGQPLAPLAAGEPLTVLLLDDDADPRAPQGAAVGFGVELLASLDEAGVPLRLHVLTPAGPEASFLAARAAAREAGRLLAVVGCRVRAWKGRPGLHPRLLALLAGLPPARLTVAGLCGPAPLGLGRQGAAAEAVVPGALGDGGFAAALGNGGFAAALGNGGFAAALGDGGFAAALGDGGFAAGAEVLLAWGDEPAAQRAAAEALLGAITPAGQLP